MEIKVRMEGLTLSVADAAVHRRARYELDCAK